MKKIYLILMSVSLALIGWGVCKTQVVGFSLQESFSEENSLVMSVNSIHQRDDFYNIQVEYPQFTDAGDAFNKKISSLIEGKIESFKKDARDNYEARRETALPENPLPEHPEQKFDFIGSWEPAQLNNDYISFVVYLYYYVGGAHGATEVHAFNYDLKKEREIALLDFLNSSQQSFEKLADLSKQKVSLQLENKDTGLDSFLEEMIENGTEPTQENYGDFNFNYNSLTVYFQKYQVAPGAAGPITIVFYENELYENSIESRYLE
jgi:hypothetical protein